MSITTVDDRYRITERIAAGGMGEVFRAHDSVLGREVAIKVLHRSLADDPGFIDRFRREARAAAMLNHPNIVAIYDWGATEGTYYMVMEFVDGRNLRDVLAGQGRLQAGQVAEVMQQVLAALAHAHHEGIVHRDIKPENILVTADGVVKVADFGLARALAESRVTQAPGTVTGTVQYLAPEQIQGETADPRTDIYSLGVVGYELLTGSVPYAAETSVAVALKHVQERVPAPSKTSSDIPREMDRLILWATERERDKRPRHAEDLAREITRVAPALPPAPPLADLVEAAPDIDLPLDGQAPTITIPREGEGAREPPGPPRKRGRGRRVLAWVLVLAALAAGGWAAWTYLVPHNATVPPVLGLAQEEATKRLEAAGFDAVTGEAMFSSDYDGGTVAAQSEAPNSQAREGSAITIRLSRGPKIVEVPNVAGRPEQQARDALEAAGLVVDVKQDFSDKVGEGDVIGQDPPAGKKVANGTTVEIRVSQGPPPVTVPDVEGLPSDQATELLKSNGLAVAQSEKYSDKVERGSVISQSIKADQIVDQGARIKIVVSLGPKQFPMPDLTGVSEAEAVKKLKDLGLKATTSRVPGSSGDRVVGQKPSAGSTVGAGSTVELFIGD